MIQWDEIIMGKKQRVNIQKKKSTESKKVLGIVGVSILIILTAIVIHNSVIPGEDTGAAIATALPGVPPLITEYDKPKGEQTYPSAPDFTLLDIHGKMFSLKDFKGKIVIIDFMGPTCKPCKDQVIELGSVQRTYGDKVEILSLSVYGGKGMNEELQVFEASNNVKWRIAIDVYGAVFSYRVKSIPTTIVIDQNLCVRYRHEGVAGAPTIIQEIKTILGEA